MSDILTKILARKVQEVHARSALIGLQDLVVRSQNAPPPRGFMHALERNVAQGKAAVIAEIKKASPSKGIMRTDFRPADIARSYALGGAACLSVLTDQDFFAGCDAYLQEARDACTLPVLRKDFTIDAYQIYEARVLGADAILLIVAALDDGALGEFTQLAQSLGMDVLMEVHDAGELQRALKTKADLIGINNRNLRTFETSIETTLQLRQAVPQDRLLVTESGITNAVDVAGMRAAGVHVFLVGETFMRAADPGAELQRLFA